MSKVTIDRELLADLLSNDREKRIHAERTLYSILAQPAQQGEAVEVVAWRTNRDEDSTFPRLHKTEQEAKRWVDVCNVAPAITHEPLMTVAQHQRILAAATHPADQVAEGVVVSRELLENCADYMMGSASARVRIWHDQCRALLNGGEV